MYWNWTFVSVPSYPLPRQQEVRKNYDDTQACNLPAVYVYILVQNKSCLYICLGLHAIAGLNSVGRDNVVVNRYIPQHRLYCENNATRHGKLQPRLHVLHTFFTVRNHRQHLKKIVTVRQQKDWKVKKSFTKSHPPTPRQYRIVYSNLHWVWVQT